MTLPEFLLARIAEDEAAAREARTDALAFSSTPPYAKLGFAASDLARRFNPIRVLAECEAKRRIAAEHEHEAVFDTVGCTICHSDNELGTIDVGWCDTIRFLSLPYADHPDYDPAWRPAE